MKLETLQKCKIGQRVYVSTREQESAYDITPLRKGHIVAIIGGRATIDFPSEPLQFAGRLYDASRIFPHIKSQEWASEYAVDRISKARQKWEDSRKSEAESFAALMAVDTTYTEYLARLTEYSSCVRKYEACGTEYVCQRENYTAEQCKAIQDNRKYSSNAALLIRQEAFWLRQHFKVRCENARGYYQRSKIRLEEYMKLLVPDAQYTKKKPTMRDYPQ